MPLFQSTVLKKYTNALDTATVDAAYERFAAHFRNPVIQENIRLAKEEQYQGEFLIDLFVKVLGYVKNPTPEFNLTTEFKNIKDSKKADGAILTPTLSKGEGENQAIGIIELKGTSVTDLGKVETQAFGYKNNQPGCVYVITSNFEKLRFYIDNAVDFEEFNLFQLSRERFEVLWLCLSAEQLLAGKPKQLKEESLSQEEQITKQLYKDYSLFRTEVFQNIVAGNPQYDKLTLFKQTQKLLDRFLFIFFAEDRLLLPPNSILSIVQQWKDLRDKYDAYTPLYDRFKKYFGYMNTGHKGQKHDIFAYNGGLFKPDPVLDDLSIDDELLYKHTVKLSNYDFVSEVSVNILGHIFEHSLNEIEEIQAELEGQPIDKSNAKRKKDGVFYTPKYITKYIVDNTVGTLCEEQKTALGIAEADYDKGRKNRPGKIVKALEKKLHDYREWLLQLTICDPACGSGAFLNQALEFLIAEHAYIDELYAKLYNDPVSLYEVENSILEHNLYGVDINNESVEIAKLSLWLRTAQKGRKLTSLNNNIKCGNSLIDDPAVAGDKAFDWEQEFPQVFSKGGFDVVIGNPPYVRVQNIDKESLDFFNNNYKTAYKNYDLYILFTEKTETLIKQNGCASYIMPKKFITTDYGKLLKEYLFKKNFLSEFIDFGVLQVFSDATTYTGIFNFDKKTKITFDYVKVEDNPENLVDIDFAAIEYDNLKEEEWLLLSKKEQLLFNKIKSQGEKLINLSKKLFQGLVTGKDAVFILEKKREGYYSKETNKFYDFKLDNNLIRPLLKGSEIGRYNSPSSDNFIIFPYNIDNDKAILKSLEEIKNLDHQVYLYLKECEPLLRSREKNKFDNEGWYAYSRNQNIAQMPKPKILTQVLAKQSTLTIDKVGKYCFVGGGTAGGYGILFKEEINLSSILPIINSKMLQWFIQKYASPFSGGYFAYSKGTMGDFPIIIPTDNTLKNKTEQIMEVVFSFETIILSLLKLLKSKLPIEKPTKNLQSWHTLDFKGFLKELKKTKVKLSLSEEAEWMAYFNTEKAKAEALQNEIDRLDREIDGMVYELYGLTEEEIGIVKKG